MKKMTGIIASGLVFTCISAFASNMTLTLPTMIPQNIETEVSPSALPDNIKVPPTESMTCSELSAEKNRVAEDLNTLMNQEIDAETRLSELEDFEARINKLQSNPPPGTIWSSSLPGQIKDQKEVLSLIKAKIHYETIYLQDIVELIDRKCTT